MHASESPVVGVTIFFLRVSIVLTASAAYDAMGVPTKCCTADQAFNEHLECVHVKPDKLNYTTHDVRMTASERSRPIVTMASVRGLSCREDDVDRRFLRTYALAFHLLRGYCVEMMVNGTMVLVRCPDKEDSTGATVVMRKTSATAVTTVTTIATTNASCHGLSMVIFWGAQTYMGTNVAHAVLCAIVVVVYFVLPELGKGIHNRAVLRHNVCLLMLGCILAMLGLCDLCECPMSDDVATFLWVSLQYFTNATGFWLNVICFDMTLSITKFRWMMGSGQRTNQEDNRRLLLYSVFAWGGALIPAVVALILDYCPGIPEDFPLKPNYRRYRDGPNLVVNLYFFGLPLLTLFWNNVLFVFTTYKIIRIQRSTEIATRNHTSVLRKKYFLFLQLYLLMGSPWFFGSLLACLNQLVVLKICRLVQPILWLLMLATDKKLRRKLASKLRCVERRKPDATDS